MEDSTLLRQGGQKSQDLGLLPESDPINPRPLPQTSRGRISSSMGLPIAKTQNLRPRRKRVLEVECQIGRGEMKSVEQLGKMVRAEDANELIAYDN